MKTAGTILQLTAVVPVAAEQPLVDLLADRFGSAVTSYVDLETEQATLTVFLNSRAEWSQAILKELRLDWTRSGVPLALPAFRLKALRKRDWAESWKRHFKPIRIGRSLLVKPPWDKSPAGGRRVIVLEPGLSFGTGHHATTEFCLTEIARPGNSGARFLDIGTGSGILAIAAAKLGLSSIRAFDIDPESIRVARENARRNRVADKIRFQQKDLRTLSGGGPKYGLVCANVISNVLVENSDLILSQLAPGGVLVLAGILAKEFPSVQQHFEKAGMQLLRGKTKKEWRSGAFGCVKAS